MMLYIIICDVRYVRMDGWEIQYYKGRCVQLATHMMILMTVCNPYYACSFILGASADILYKSLAHRIIKSMYCYYKNTVHKTSNMYNLYSICFQVPFYELVLQFRSNLFVAMRAI